MDSSTDDRGHGGQGNVTRRRLMLGGGGVAAAGAAGALLNPPAALAATPATDVTFTPTGNIQATDVQAALVELDGEKQHLAWLDARMAGAKGDGVFDNTTAINNAAALMAAAGGGTVLLSPGHYRFSGLITIPSGVDLWGCGGHKQGAGYFGTVLEATSASSQLMFQDTGGQSGNFILDGRKLANHANGKGLLYVNFCVERLFTALQVINSHAAGVVVEQTQNCTFTAFVVTHNDGDGLVLDIGAGGNAFLRNEFNASGGNTIVIRETAPGTGPYDDPQHNYFLHCVIERGPYPDGANNTLLTATAGSGNTFNHCIFALHAPNTSASGALVVLSGSAVNFVQCNFSGDAGVGLRNNSAGAFFYDRNWFNIPTAVEWNGTAHGNVVGIIEYGGAVTTRWTGTGTYNNLAFTTTRQHLIHLDAGATYGLRIARTEDPTGYRFQVSPTGEISVSDANATFTPKARWKLQADGSGWETPDDVLLNGGALTVQERTTTPANPTAGDQATMYVKGDKLVVAFNEGGTMRYRYMLLTGTTAAWTYSASAP